jgi:hypothetical protein
MNVRLGTERFTNISTNTARNKFSKLKISNMITERNLGQ